MDEVFKPVVGYEGRYEVSNLGRIRNSRRGSILAPRQNQFGYSRVALFKDGNYSHRVVHRLVAEAFHGPEPEGKPFVLHGDDNPGNNRAENLRWGSPADNMQDKKLRGRDTWGTKTHCVNGHEYTESTTYWNARGHRSCKVCRSNHTRASQKRAQRRRKNLG